MNRQQIAKSLQEYRKHNNLTQRNLAVILGCHINTYISWETGVSMPNEEYQVRINRLLKRGE